MNNTNIDNQNGFTKLRFFSHEAALIIILIGLMFINPTSETQEIWTVDPDLIVNQLKEDYKSNKITEDEVKEGFKKIDSIIKQEIGTDNIVVLNNRALIAGGKDITPLIMERMYRVENE